MKCKVCGEIINEHDQFCSSCGTKVIKPTLSPNTEHTDKETAPPQKKTSAYQYEPEVFEKFKFPPTDSHGNAALDIYSHEVQVSEYRSNENELLSAYMLVPGERILLEAVNARRASDRYIKVMDSFGMQFSRIACDRKLFERLLKGAEVYARVEYIEYTGYRPKKPRRIHIEIQTYNDSTESSAI